MSQVSYTTECRTVNVKTCPADSYKEMCENFNCYELLPNDRKIKPYFDIEIKPKHCIDGQEYFDITEAIVTIAMEEIEKYFKNPKVAILNASSANYKCCKTGETLWISSLHIIVSNYAISKNQLLSIVKQMNQTLTIKQSVGDYFELREKSFGLFDESIYDANRKIRSAFANKTHYDIKTKSLIVEERPFTIINDASFEDTIITEFFNKDFIEIPDDTQFKSISSSPNPSPISIVNDFDNNNKHIDLLIKLGNNNIKRSDWVTICGWCHTHSNKESFLKIVSSEWKDEASKMWDTMKAKPIPIFWIETFAKRHNLEIYKVWLDYWNVYFIPHDIIDDPFAVATIISSTLKSNLILCNEVWYMLSDKQLWLKQKEPSFYIINELRKYIDESNKKVVWKISQSEGDTKAKYIEQSSAYLRSYKSISTSGFLNVLTKFLKTLLADNTFAEKLDNNAGFLCFKNGIMNLETKEFRIGIQADDFISQTIPYDYSPLIDIKKQSEIKEILLQILNNNKEHLEYFLSLIGFSFIGSPHLEKSIYFCVDKTTKSAGDNGKTFFFDILSTLFPNYVYKTDKSFLEDGNKKTHKQLINMKAKRLVWLDEFNEKKVNDSLIKVIGEGSQIENEIMFGTSEIIDIMFKAWILTNHIPAIDAKEQAVYNRFKQISYNSHFDRTGKRIKPNPEKLEFIADTTLGDKLKKEFFNDIFHIVIDYAHNYYKLKIPSIPLQFQNDAEATKMKNDVFGTWFMDHCEINETERIALKALIDMSELPVKIIKEGMERMGFKYDKDLSKLGKDNFNKAYKGGFIGCKILPDAPEEEE
jgi:phage/plasmid-associated DNA primase